MAVSVEKPIGAAVVEQRMLVRAFAHLDKVALGGAFGIVSGALVWIATVVLLLRGGPNMGYHLSRLGHFLPGYSVSWGGAFLGLLEGAVIGFAVGFVFAGFWNLYHRMFLRLARAREVRRELQEL